MKKIIYLTCLFFMNVIAQALNPWQSLAINDLKAMHQAIVETILLLQVMPHLNLNLGSIQDLRKLWRRSQK